jgi:hypothetical protein
MSPPSPSSVLASQLAARQRMPAAARTESPRTKEFAPAQSTDLQTHPEAMYPVRVAGTSPIERMVSARLCRPASVFPVLAPNLRQIT